MSGYKKNYNNQPYKRPYNNGDNNNRQWHNPKTNTSQWQRQQAKQPYQSPQQEWTPRTVVPYQSNKKPSVPRSQYLAEQLQIAVAREEADLIVEAKMAEIKRQREPDADIQTEAYKLFLEWQEQVKAGKSQGQKRKYESESESEEEDEYADEIPQTKKGRKTTQILQKKSIEENEELMPSNTSDQE